MAVLHIPHAYRSYTQGVSQAQVNGATVGEAFQDLLRQYPSLRMHLVNGRGELRPFINLMLNGDNIKNLQGLETPLNEADTLRLVPSIAGG